MPTTSLDFARTIAAWWRKVQDDVWGDVKAETLQRVQRLWEVSMQEALTVYTQAAWHARTSHARLYRNGSATRTLSTALGRLPALRVPRRRDGGVHPTGLPRYQSGGRRRFTSSSRTSAWRA